MSVVVFLYSESFCVEMLIAQQCLYHRVVRGELLFNTNRDNYTCMKCSKLWQSYWIPQFNVPEGNLLPCIILSFNGPKSVISVLNCVQNIQVVWDMLLYHWLSSFHYPSVKS